MGNLQVETGRKKITENLALPGVEVIGVAARRDESFSRRFWAEDDNIENVFPYPVGPASDLEPLNGIS